MAKKKVDEAVAEPGELVSVVEPVVDEVLIAPPVKESSVDVTAPSPDYVLAEQRSSVPVELIAAIDAHLSVVDAGNAVSPSETQRLLRAAVNRLR